MGHRAVSGIIADAQNLRTRAHLAVRRVVEDIALEGARSLQAKAGGFETDSQAGQVIHAKFDLGFDGHRQQ